jgi:hypothetical protein
VPERFTTSCEVHLRIDGSVLLAGWLLMSPPLTKDAKAPSGYRVDTGAKLDDWSQVSAHDSAADCERARSARIVDLIGAAQQLSGKKDALEQPMVNAATRSLCVPTDTIYAPAPADDGQCTTAAPARL